MKFEHEVKRVSWNEELGQWILQYVNLSVPNMEEQTQIFDIIINAPGALRIPLIPDQFEAFKGPTIHTAEWNHEIELKNKKVAVIGSGASAVQVIPSIVDSVETLHCYQRKPPYILPRAQCSFPGSVKFIFRHFPVVMRLFRYIIFTVHELLYSAFRPGSLMYRLISRVSKAYRQNVLKNHKHLWDDLTPKYTIGCKRVILSEQYYPAMARPNVQLHTSPIDNIVDQTIYTKDGSKNEIDVLILATGFRVSDYFGPLEVIGKGGKNILKSWMDDRPRSYYGVSFCDTPNYFYLLGPNTVLGHNSVIFMIECQVNFILNAISEMMKRKAKVLNLKLSAEEEFMNQIDADMKTTVW
ncbi:Baeyer-Villiger monooxygenase, partial [Pseudolycoriella hygida]